MELHGAAVGCDSGKPIGEPMKHENGVNSAQFSPDGQRVVTAYLITPRGYGMPAAVNQLANPWSMKPRFIQHSSVPMVNG